MNKQLISILSEVFGLRRDQIVPELTKEDVESWDSLKQMDLVMSLEREFNIALNIPDIVKMNSVASIVDVLKDKGIDFGN